jgi:hypothetical protein
VDKQIGKQLARLETHLAEIDKNVTKLANVPPKKSVLLRMVMSGITIGASIVGIATFILQILHLI